MFPYKTMSSRRTFPMAAGLTSLLAMALGGCSLVHHWSGHDESAGPAAPMTTQPEGSAQVTASAEPQTVTSNLPEVEPEADNAAPAASGSTSGRFEVTVCGSALEATGAEPSGCVVIGAAGAALSSCPDQWWTSEQPPSARASSDVSPAAIGNVRRELIVL